MSETVVLSIWSVRRMFNDAVCADSRLLRTHMCTQLDNVYDVHPIVLSVILYIDRMVISSSRLVAAGWSRSCVNLGQGVHIMP